MDFAALKSRLLQQIGRAPSELCYELTTADINQKLRLTDMLKTVTVTEAAEISLPSDFLEIRRAYVGSNPEYPMRPATGPSLMVSPYVGRPTEYMIDSDTMVLNRVSGGSESVTIDYYGSLPDLEADADTNAVLTKFPQVYVYGILAHHAALVRDQNALAVHFPAFERALSQARASDNLKRMGGAQQAIKVRSTP